jgi:hypothetical protein
MGKQREKTRSAREKEKTREGKFTYHVLYTDMVSRRGEGQ